MKSAVKWALKAIWGRSADRIHGLIDDSVSVVSFDVFDTLLIRSCGTPERVFELVGQRANELGIIDDPQGFVKARIAAENAARSEAGPNNEVTLAEIYRRLASAIGIHSEELMREEMACELAVCKPNPAVVVQLKAVKKRKRIVVISDTYLPEPFIRLLLEENGINGFEELYVSNDYRKMKRNGKLFEVVIDEMGMAPDKILHVGDHPLADWVSPRKLGVRCFLLKNDNRRGYDVSPSENMCERNVLMYQESWIVGGIESFVMNELRHLPQNKYGITLCSTWGEATVFAHELDAMNVGRHIEFEGNKPNIAVRTIYGLRAFDWLMAQRRFDVVHVNTQNGMGLAYAWLAKRRGIPVRIVHSHSSWFGGKSWIIQRQGIHMLGKLLFGNTPTVRIACNEEAGKHLFGMKAFQIIQNGIDVKKFEFSNVKREKIRRAYGIDNESYVIGSIGRISPEKNPEFQIETFAKLHKMLSNSKFVMVGSGSSEKAVDELVGRLGLKECFIRVPSTSSSEAYCSAMDLFLLPSEHEGTPLAAIEAQCSGLQILAASHLPQSIAITDLVEWESLDCGVECWACRAKKMLLNNSHQRGKYVAIVEAGGFAAQSMSREIEALYSNGL